MSDQRDATVDEAIERLGSCLWKYVWDVSLGMRHYMIVRTEGYEGVVYGDSLRECIEKAETWIEETQRETAETIAGVRWEIPEAAAGEAARGRR